ncbi:hypothetical protein NQ315_004457 [Exocentrus adspersus]|uniref:Cytochrome P450 n=1 Tax=Exocentrus adspersus TaxID=1586481 RepID=A0AAV8VQS4_9CUCU|nr:hypothetical protein NQ315_004457 [Exocentrus adspersus]
MNISLFKLLVPKNNIPAKSKPVKDLSEIDVVAQAMIFFLAGFDSVSTLMCFTTYELAANPDIQDRLRQEVMTTLDECGGKITYEGLLKMKYLDMVVSEVLRKWPSTLATDRLCLKPYTINPALPDEQPLHLEEGSILMIPIYGMHHDQEYFPNPDRFDPDRFNDENKDNIKPYTYFPFGLGPRNCIGSRFALLENKVLMFYILMYFEIVPVERSRIPVQLSKTSINLTAEGGFWFGLKRLKR